MLYVNDNYIKEIKGNGGIAFFKIGNGIETDPTSGVIYGEKDMIKTYPLDSPAKRWTYEGPITSTPLTVDVYNKIDQSILDTDIFSFSYDQSKLDINVFSNSGAKAGVYDLQFKVENPGYNNAFTFDISVTVVEICTVEDADYKIGDNQLIKPIFKTDCVNIPTIQSHEIRLEGTVVNPSFIVYNSATASFDI